MARRETVHSSGFDMTRFRHLRLQLGDGFLSVGVSGLQGGDAGLLDVRLAGLGGHLLPQVLHLFHLGGAEMC